MKAIFLTILLLLSIFTVKADQAADMLMCMAKLPGCGSDTACSDAMTIAKACHDTNMCKSKADHTEAKICFLDTCRCSNPKCQSELEG